MASSPSARIADSLSLLSKSVYQVLSDVEDRSQSEVARVLSDALEARTERDDKSKKLEDAQIEAQRYREEVLNLSASLKHAEMTIAHQAETISLLRRESTQWKDQSRNWQEHFLRVEQERCALSTRIDELVSERLQHNSSTDVSPLTPVSRYADEQPTHRIKYRATSTGSTQPLVAPPTLPLSPPDVDSPSSSTRRPTTHLKTPNARKPLPGMPRREARDALKPSASAVKSRGVMSQKAESSQRKEPQIVSQRVIRRVQAVVRVKKEEDDEDEENDELADDVPLSNDRDSSPVLPRRKSAGRRTIKVVPDVEDWSEGGDDSGGSLFDGRTVEHDEINEEDDELMMGAEDNHDEVYGVTPSASNKRPASAPRPPTPPSKRPKLSTTTPGTVRQMSTKKKVR